MLRMEFLQFSLNSASIGHCLTAPNWGAGVELEFKLLRVFRNYCLVESEFRMSEKQSETTCAFCKEDIKVEAIKCKHCGSMLKAKAPAHEGICPYCKESIHPDAIKCKHCKSALGEATSTDGAECRCGCHGDSEVASQLARRFGGGIGVPVYGGGRVVTDPGHDCWGACVDKFVDCKLNGSTWGVPGECEFDFQICKLGCPQSGPRFGY